MRRKIFLLVFWLLLIGCTPPPTPITTLPVDVKTLEPTHSEPTATRTPKPTPTATLTATPTITPTPAPTLAPNAITAANVDDIHMVLELYGPRNRVRGVALSPNGARAAAASSDYSVYLFDTVGGEELYELRHHSQYVYAVEFSPDGLTLLSGAKDRTFQIWDPIKGLRLGGARANGEVNRIAFSPDGARFATAGFYSAIGEIWQLPDGARIATLEGHTTRLRSVAYDPTGSYMATGDEKGTVILRSAETGDPQISFDTGNWQVLSLAFSPDRRYLAIGLARQEIVIYDVRDREIVTRWAAHGSAINRVIYSPDGSLLISCGDDGLIRFWDASSYERLTQRNVHGASVLDCAISRDGSTLASGGNDARILISRISPELSP
jgi:WD40 repeat protein